MVVEPTKAEKGANKVVDMIEVVDTLEEVDKLVEGLKIRVDLLARTNQLYWIEAQRVVPKKIYIGHFSFHFIAKNLHLTICPPFSFFFLPKRDPSLKP